jgi:MFS family permease
MANIDTAIINVATPSIGRTLGASGAELQLTVSVYILATAMLLVTAARLGVLYGYRRVVLAGIVTFTLASLACGIAPEILSLIVARVVQGAGAALMIAQVMSGIQRTLTGDARTRAIGAYTTTLSLGAVIGQILGGLLITLNLFGLAWRPLFLINVPIGLVLLAVAWFALPHDLPHAGARPISSASPCWRWECSCSCCRSRSAARCSGRGGRSCRCSRAFRRSQRSSGGRKHSGNGAARRC